MAAARHDPVTRLIRAGLFGSLLLLAVQSAAGLVASLDFHSYSSPVDLERNNGLPDVLSTAVILAAALGAAALAAAATRDRWQAAALSILLAIVALDDVLQEEVGGSNLSNVWGISVVVTLATAALLIIAVARHAPRVAGLGLVMGLCFLAAAVYAADGYAQFLNLLGRGDQERGDLDYEVGVVLKQGLELLGWSFVAIGVWATVVAVRVQARSRSAASASSRLARSVER
jgi:hypothetical protein